MTARDFVLIVGAGPTGLSAALELSRLGVPVRLVDRRSEPSTTSRALALQARTLELLDARGVGAEMVRIGYPTVATSIYGDGKRLARIDLTAIPSRHNSILMLPQSETERLLSEQVCRQGVTIERGVELVTLSQGEAATHHDEVGGLRAVLRQPGGELELVEPAYLVDCEGSHSTIRRTLNLPFTGRSFPTGYALADLHIEGTIPDDEISVFAANQGLLAIFPIRSGHFRFIASDTGNHDRSAPPPDLAELQRLYDANSHIPARLHDIVWTSRFWINSRMLGQLRDRRIFFGGDSAHVHSPAGGQGMNTGIQDMINLGWKLAAVLRGHAHPDLLDTYAGERLPIIHKVVRGTETGTEVLSSGSGLVHSLFTHLAPWVLGSETIQHVGVAQISQVDHHYRNGALAQTHRTRGTFQAGDRVPDGPVTVHDEANGDRVADLQSLLDPSGFTLLMVCPSAAPLPAFNLLERTIGTSPPRVVRVTPASPSRSDPVFGDGPTLVLVRPDGYAGFVGRADEPDALGAWVDRWFPDSPE